MTGKLPPSASQAQAQEGGKLHAPAAARNAEALCNLLARVAPPQGRALELASGTGQHVIAFAQALPDLRWQPTELDPARRASIEAHRAEADLPNIAPAAALDATAPGWAARFGGQDLIVLVNLLHLISSPAAERTLTEIIQALAPGGRAVIYGPFKRDGALTSAGDSRFDAELRAADPAIGYKDSAAIQRWIAAAGASLVEIAQMPANNLAFVIEKR